MVNFVDIALIIDPNAKNISDAKLKKFALSVITSPEFNFGEICDRCSGYGHYSHNGQNSICYKCSGVGKVAPKATVELLENVQVKISQGALSERSHRILLRKQLKSAADKVMDLWKSTGVASAYSKAMSDNNVREIEGLFETNKQFADFFTWSGRQSLKAQNTKGNLVEKSEKIQEFWNEFENKYDELKDINWGN